MARGVGLRAPRLPSRDPRGLKGVACQQPLLRNVRRLRDTKGKWAGRTRIPAGRGGHGSLRAA